MPTFGRATRRALIGSLAVSALVGLLAVTFAGSSTTTEAHAGQYAHFPGPDAGYISVPDAPDLKPTSAITIEAWVMLSSYEAWGASSCPVVAGKGYTDSYWLGICGPLRFYGHDGISADGAGLVPLNVWTHVAVTYDGTNTKFYINGALDATATNLTGDIGANNDEMRIGADVDYRASPKGALDEVRLWNVARSGPDIAASMNTTITTPQAGLVGVWNMEGDGSDALGNHNGTPLGDIAFSATPLESGTPTPTSAPTGSPAPTPTPSPSPTPGAFEKGDVNCDGARDANDIMPYLKYSAGAGPFPAPCGASAAAAPQGEPFGQWLNLGASTGGYVSIPDDPALNPAGAITIEVLVNPYSYTTAGGSGCQSLVGKGYTTAYWLGLCYGHPRFYPRGADRIAPRSCRFGSGPTSPLSPTPPPSPSTSTACSIARSPTPLRR